MDATYVIIISADLRSAFM